MSEPTIHLRPSKERPVLLGHPWIFSGAIRDLDPALEPGTLVSIHTAAGEFLGRGYANPRCSIAVRVLTRADEPLDAPFFERRVATALALRRAVLSPDTDAYRLINGDGDFLSGFIADVYGPIIVLQCLTAGAARLKAKLVAALQGALAPVGIYERSTGSVRREEGLEAAQGVVAGDVPVGPLWVREAGHRFVVDVRSGQKTGFFLDQRDNRALVEQLAAGRSVLNAFAYTGAFSVYAGAGHARHVVSVESSARALDLAQQNWEGNALSSAAAEFVEADVFQYLRDTERSFDLLDSRPAGTREAPPRGGARRAGLQGSSPLGVPPRRTGRVRHDLQLFAARHGGAVLEDRPRCRSRCPQRRASAATSRPGRRPSHQPGASRRGVPEGAAATRRGVSGAPTPCRAGRARAA